MLDVRQAIPCHDRAQSTCIFAVQAGRSGTDASSFLVDSVRFKLWENSSSFDANEQLDTSASGTAMSMYVVAVYSSPYWIFDT